LGKANNKTTGSQYVNIEGIHGQFGLETSARINNDEWISSRK